MPGNGEMTCYLLLHNRNGEYTLWGNELEKYRTRIFERVDLMRDRSGYICDRSEIGQHPPLQRVYSSATFEQLLTQVCQTWPQYTRNLRQPKTWPESFCLGEDRQPAMPSLAARKVDFTQGRLLPTLMPVMSSVDRETRQLQLLLVMGVDDSLGGVVRLNGTLYPAFAVPSADNSQLVISALTDKGLRYAGYGVAVNHDADSHISPAPELMEFHLKTREAPLLLPSTHQKNSRIICSARWVLIVPGTNGGARKMHEHTPPRGDMIAVGHSECEQYFVLFNIVLCSSMFFDVHRQG